MRQTICRLPYVISQVGLAKSTIYLRIGQGLWTKPISLGSRAVGWPLREIEALNASRIAGKCNQEIRELVAKLEAHRKMADTQ